MTDESVNETDAGAELDVVNDAGAGGPTQRVSLQELKELFAGNGMIGYVMKERVDGKLVLPEAVQLLQMKGTAGA